jgi:hypothetical protein
VLNATFSASATGASYTIYNTLGTIGYTSASQSVMGQVKWTVRWTESYPGEPVPHHAPVELKGYGHSRIDVLRSGMPWDNAMGTATLVDAFANLSYTRSTPGSGGQGTATDADLGTLTAGTGAFSLVSSGVYESTISFSINAGATQSVASSAVVVSANSDLYRTITITKIGNQNM